MHVAVEVRAALADGAPVVALESTIITHGLPPGDNLATARAAEALVRATGAVPATVGVTDGTPTVGLDDAALTRLATGSAVKAAIRDLPVAAAKRLDAGTTVAATAYLAHRAGITVFATGGLGGVHHGAETTFDESADLPALATLPIVLVSAGVKSILNIPATLERLETLSIPVLGYRTTAFPAFYVADSGHPVEHTVASPAEVAATAAARDALGLPQAVLVANPIPAADQLDPAWHRRLLADAHHAAARDGVTGNRTTPFLLDAIQRATGGRSVTANVAAYHNNVRLAAEIAVALADHVRS